MEYRSATTAARSEKNLQRAEEWGIKALDVEPLNAQPAYFLATEVYLPQKKYKKMAAMLSEAIKRNPDQRLEKPFRLDGAPVETIAQGVAAYREQEWASVYNKAVEYIQDANNVNKSDKVKHIEQAKEQLELAMLVNPQNVESYNTLAVLYLQGDNLLKSKEIIDLGLSISNSNYMLWQLKGDIASSEKDFTSAIKYYEKSIINTEDPSSIMRKLIFVYIDIGENEKAIEYSNDLLDKYPNDPDLYYNVGVLYQRLSIESFEPALEIFNKLSKDSDEKIIIDVYKSFKQARKYAYNAKDNFLQASDLEIEETSTRQAVSEMRKLLDNLDDTFLPSIKERAAKANIKLN